MSALTILMLAAVLIVAVPLAVLALECFASLSPARGEDDRLGNTDAGGAIAVLMPAHNEERNIARTLETIRSQLRDNDLLCVVADNCTDATANVARGYNAEVLERFDDFNRGKGFALDAGLRSLPLERLDAVVLVDADCLPQAGALDRLRRAVSKADRPVQARYLMTPATGAGVRQSVSQFAVAIKNHVRPRGLAALGLPCLLTGSGIALPTRVAKQLVYSGQLATGDIVEDMRLSYDLMLMDAPPVFCEEACVLAELPPCAEGESTQRTRWEHGHLQTIVGQAPRLLHAAAIGKPMLALMTLDLIVPPLSLLMMSWVAVVTMSLVFAVVTGEYLPIALGLFVGAASITALIAAWARFCRGSIKATTLLAAPFYALAKISIYLRFLLMRRQKQWVRTQRA